MGVRHFEDLVAWRLARTLSNEVFAETEHGPASRDFKFRDQIRDSAASARRNIAEGFGLFRPTDFARFLGYAKGSLQETRDSLIEGRDRGYFTAELASRLINLERAAEKATTNLMLAKLRQAAEERDRKRRNRPR
jgi:four helix bundle protein